MAKSLEPSLHLTHIPAMNTGMLIRKPPAQVFAALVDPAITTRFWFTKSSGTLAPGATVQWEWEMYSAKTAVHVKQFEANQRLVLVWGTEDAPRTFEVRFVPWLENTATYVHITETGYKGTGDEILARIVDSMGGFTSMLAALKALLEHNVLLTLVLDKHPKGLQV